MFLEFLIGGGICMLVALYMAYCCVTEEPRYDPENVIPGVAFFLLGGAYILIGWLAF